VESPLTLKIQGLAKSTKEHVSAQVEWAVEIIRCKPQKYV
jgi:hypothetical protein